MLNKYQNEKHAIPLHMWKHMIEACRGIMPDGGPLDDEWPDWVDKVAEGLTQSFPAYFDADFEYYELVNDLMVDTCLK